MRRMLCVAASCALVWACGKEAAAPVAPGSVSPEQDGGVVAPPPPPDAGPMADGGVAVRVDPYKELVIVDSTVVLDARASNASDGAWSFRRTIERLTPSGTTPSSVAERWLRSFRNADVAGHSVDDRARVDDLLAAWPRNGDGSLDLGKAPFRLVAISSRLDLTTSAQGEGRLIYGLVDASGKGGLMTAAFEFNLPALGTANDRQAWAARWHALSSHPFGEEFNAALQGLTDTFATASSFAQARTNEAALGSPWELREWKLGSDGLRPSTTWQTPDQSLNGSGTLAQFIVDHAADIRAGHLNLPRDLHGGTALETGAWRFPNDSRIDEGLRHAFAVQTCNGCHAAETFSAQGFFHVNPLPPIARGSDGHDRLSEFLRRQELPRRADHLAALVAGTATQGTAARADARVRPAKTPAFDVTLIPAPEDGSPVAINGGRVLGNSESRGPWIYDGAMHYFMSGDARAPVAQGFNAKGDVVGYFSAGGKRRAFVLSKGTVTELGTLGGNDSAATLINDSGLIAGDSKVSSGTPHGFIWSGALQDIQSLGGGETFPYALSAGGRLTGQSQLAADTFISHAFVWSAARGMTDLGTLGGLYSRGQTVDDSGFVTGFSTLVPSDEKVHAFTWDGSTMVDLGSAPGLPWSAVVGRNASGTMVGNIYDVPSPDAKFFEIHAFIHVDGVMVDLNDITTPPRVLHTALGIDDGGHILCTDGQVGDVHAHGLLLTPK